MWAFQEVFPGFRWRDRICRKLSKLMEEHGEKKYLWLWNPAYGQWAWAEERAEDRLWVPEPKTCLFFCLCSKKPNSACLQINGVIPQVHLKVLVREKKKPYKVWLITVVQITHFKWGKLNNCLSNFLIKTLSLSKYVFSGFSWIFLLEPLQFDCPWTESLSVSMPSFLSSWPISSSY